MARKSVSLNYVIERIHPRLWLKAQIDVIFFPYSAACKFEVVWNTGEGMCDRSKYFWTASEAMAFANEVCEDLNAQVRNVA